MNNHVTVLEIDGSALSHNLSHFKKQLHPTTKILAVVKAFGYGSDGIQIATFLEKKVDYFAVAYAHEGIALREAGIKAPILVLHPQIPNLVAIVNYCLEPNIYNFKIFNAFLKVASQTALQAYPIHVKLNTGLNRLGFSTNDVPSLLARLKATKRLKVQSLFSHLAVSEEIKEQAFTNQQITIFSESVQQFQTGLGYKPILHILNTSGVINYPKAQFDMVRIGIGLYGFGNDTKETNRLQNTHNLKSIISQIHTIKPEESVGYNRAFIAQKKTITATIPIGHADGISRKLGKGKGHVRINGQKASIIGNVCMDMIMVDVTTIDCTEGDEVIVFNSQEMIQEIADVTATIPYETLTAISQRVQKKLKS
ncbi:MAG: alanine racemase [Polaribacter sp.]